jgi:hypothetical protein
MVSIERHNLADRPVYGSRHCRDLHSDGNKCGGYHKVGIGQHYSDYIANRGFDQSKCSSHSDSRHAAIHCKSHWYDEYRSDMVGIERLSIDLWPVHGTCYGRQLYGDGHQRCGYNQKRFRYCDRYGSAAAGGDFD